MAHDLAVSWKPLDAHAHPGRHSRPTCFSSFQPRTLDAHTHQTRFTQHQPIENSVQPLLRAPAAGKKGMQAWGARRALKKETIQQTEGSHWSPTPPPQHIRSDLASRNPTRRRPPRQLPRALRRNYVAFSARRPLSWSVRPSPGMFVSARHVRH